MNIGLDFDGVIADTTDLKIDAARKLFGVRVEPEQCKEEVVVASGILKREQYREIMRHVCEIEETGLRMKACKDAIEYLKKFSTDGHSLTIITSRNDREILIAAKWCVLHDISLPIVPVGYGKTKVDAVKEKTIDAYIDDDVSKLLPLRDVVPHLFLFSTLQNKNINTSTEIMRVTWESFYKKVSSIRTK